MSMAPPAFYVMIRTAISMQMEKLKSQPPSIPIPHSHTLHSLLSERLHQHRILSSSGKEPTSCLSHSHTNTNQGLQFAHYQIKPHQNTRLQFLKNSLRTTQPSVRCFCVVYSIHVFERETQALLPHQTEKTGPG